MVSTASSLPGGRLIDAADVYSAGASEEIIGRWLKARGGTDDLVLATKRRFATSDDPADRSAGRAHLERALAAILRLGGDPTRGLEAYDVRNNALTWILRSLRADVPLVGEPLFRAAVSRGDATG